MISIVVLSFNNFGYYKHSIGSILDQDYNDIEIIISDDASHYFDKNIILNFISKYNNGNIKNVYINKNEENLGVVKNYNKALEKANGDIIFYLPMDDVLYKNNTIQNIRNYFNENPDIYIATGYRLVCDKYLKTSLKLLPRPCEVQKIRISSPYELYEILCLGSFIAGSCTPFKKKLIKERGYLDESYTMLEDYPRYLNLLRTGYRFGFIDNILIKYRLGGMTTKGRIDDLLRKDYIRTAEIEKRNFIKNTYNYKILNKPKLVGWGTRECYRECRDLYNIKVDYLIDSNNSIQGSYIDDIEVSGPEILDDKHFINDLGILIFSHFNFWEISSILEKKGFQNNIHYTVCTPDIIKVLKNEKLI